MNNSQPRIFFIWSRLPGYALSSLTKLKLELNNNLMVKSIGDPPLYLHDSVSKLFSELEYYPRKYEDRKLYYKIVSDVESFAPDFLIVTGWNLKIIRQVARHFKKQNIVTVCMADTPWEGSIKQITKALLGRFILHQCFNIMWVPGLKASILAKFVGFKDNNLWLNLYCADSDVYLYSERDTAEVGNFLFIGRYEIEKNIDGLVTSYIQYRKRSKNPWNLICVGGGKLEHKMLNVEGILLLGWRNSAEIAMLMKSCNALFLPSTFEPWGVVVHEAVSAGLPLLLSTEVGSGAEFLVNYFNGRYFNPNNIDEITECLLWAQQNFTKATRSRSFEISKRLTKNFWVEYLLEKITNYLKSQ